MGGRNVERPFYQFDEVPFFAKNEALCLRRGEVFAPLGIGLQACAVRLVGSQAVKRNQPPRDVICSFVRQKVADEMPAAARNDAAPILGVLLERISLKRIDLVADDTQNPHG